MAGKSSGILSIIKLSGDLGQELLIALMWCWTDVVLFFFLLDAWFMEFSYTSLFYRFFKTGFTVGQQSICLFSLKR